MAATLEPAAIEPQLSGTFTYTVAPDESKMLMSAWFTQIGTASGRLDLRDQDRPLPFLPLTDIDLFGADAASMAMIIDPTLATYTEAMGDYYNRLETIATTKPRKIDLDAAETFFPLLPGAYGAIITGYTAFNLTWIALITPYGTASGLPIGGEEIGDVGADDHFRYGRTMLFPVSTLVCGGILTGATGGFGDPNGVVTYVLLPSTWSAVPDTNVYLFRDDFMGATLNTASTWTRAQSSAGNVEINTDFQWLKVVGNSSWNANGAFTQSGITRADDVSFVVDALMVDGGVHITGFQDGSGLDVGDFAHSFLISSWLGGAADINVFENGNNRGVVGSGVTANALYRFRITLTSGSDAVYEIQGGPEYDAIGSSTWTDITPGTSSSPTNTLHPGFTINGGSAYFGDARVIA